MSGVANRRVAACARLHQKISEFAVHMKVGAAARHCCGALMFNQAGARTPANQKGE
jgi:hypothetical protein